MSQTTRTTEVLRHEQRGSGGISARCLELVALVATATAIDTTVSSASAEDQRLSYNMLPWSTYSQMPNRICLLVLQRGIGRREL